MAKHTEGAVHLTSLSLDLTQFNENIQQIQNSTAEAADVAVQNLSKIRESLNVPTEQMTLSVDTAQVTQNIRQTTDSIKSFGQVTREVNATIENITNTSLDKQIDAIAKSLNRAGYDVQETSETLGMLMQQIGNDFTKISIVAKNTGKRPIFQAVVDSANDAGQAIQRVYNLRKLIALDDGAEGFEIIKTQVVDKATTAIKEQVINVEALKAKFDALRNSSQALYIAMSNSQVQSAGMKELTEQTGEFIQRVIETSNALNANADYADTANQAYNSLNRTQSLLVRIYKELNKEEEESVTTATASADSIYRLALQYSNLAKAIEKSDIADNENMIALIKATKDAEEELKDLAYTLENADDGAVNIKAIAARVDELSSSLIKSKIEFSDTQREQQKFIDSAAALDKLPKKIYDLANQFANLSKNIASSDVSEKSGMVILASQADRASKELVQLAEDLRNGKITAEEATQKYNKLAESLSAKKLSFTNFSKSQQEFIESAKLAESLGIKYERLQTQIERLTTSMAKFGTSTPEMKELMRQVEQLKLDVVGEANAIQESGIASEQSSKKHDDLTASLERQRQAFEKQKQGAEIYKQSLEPIQKTVQSTISSLKTLEKTAVFKTSKDKVAALRAEYEEFLNKLKNTNIGVDVAEKELSDLQKQFNELESTVKRGNGTLENWVNKITESAKWQIANSALNLLQQSFGQLTTTIIDTEDAVIELRRVLNDKSLVDSEMTQTLYDIAYEFGQTFDNVQEVAVKFAQTGKTWEETVAATRATMLGLNTAELEVSTATEGLIAVMAQFNVEADDLKKVIDKINITADKFPVTSEKIVAALQRAGGTARAFGMSLDETIGVITALSKATGRAGEAIGTAMNSLITFSMKSSSLDKFSEFLGQDVSNFDVLELWQSLAEEINNGNESLATMMSTSEEFNSLMDEELAASIGLTEEFTKAQEEANKMTAEGKDIYSTVGTYRQNYFIALLNNIATATEAIEGMSGAVGYSMQENEVAMESFGKKWNQLIVSAKELAIQFGEAGFLDLMKGAVEASSAVLQLTKSLGGLRTVLIALTTIIIAVKKEKINSYIVSTGGAIKNLRAATQLYSETLALTGSRIQAFSGALSALQLTMGGWITLAMTAVTAISAVAGAINRAKEAAKEARAESAQEGLESAEKVVELAEAYDTYRESLENTDIEQQNAARIQLIELLGYEADDLDILANKYDNLDAKIKELTEDEYTRLKLKAESSRIDAEKAFGDIEAQTYSVMPLMESLVYPYKDFDEFEANTKKLWETLQGYGVESAEALQDAMSGTVKTYDEAVQSLNTIAGMLKFIDASWDSTQRSQYKEFIDQLIARNEDLAEKIKNWEYYDELVNLFGDDISETADKVSEYNEAAEEATNSTDTAGQSFETIVMSIEEMDNAIDDLNKKMDSFQSSVKSVESIISQYNQTGVMTADMLQTLIGLAPEYIDLIDINSGSLSLNQEKLENLMKVNDNYMVQMAAMKIAKEYEALATELQQEKYDNLTAAEIQNMITTNALGGEIYQLAMQLYSGQINADQFKKAIQQAGEKSGLAANKVSVLTQSMADLASNMSGVINLAGMFPNLSLNASVKVNGKTIEEWEKDRQRGIISEATFQKYLEQSRNMAVSTPSSGTKTWFPSTTTKTGGGAGGNADKFKAEKDALSDLLEVYEHSILLIEHNEKDSAKAGKEIAAIYRKMQDEVHAQAERYRAAGLKDTDSEIMELQKKWLDYQDKIEEVLHGIYEETVAAHERAINYLEHQYDSAEQRLDYSFMGENLKKQLDYQVKIQREAERELERLAQLGMDANSEAAQDVIDTWYDAEKSIRDISQKIQESILQPYEDFIDLADKFDIWEYMDFTKVDYLRMELQEVNNMLANGTMSLKEYNAQLKQLSYAIYDAQKELFDKQKTDVEAAKDEVVKGYKSDIDSLKDQKEQIEDYYKTVIDGYNAEIDAWEDRKDKVNEYYDTLIDNLNDVQAANERINAQVDYYNERQKIITNLEQAQARSGVEWREKEMEYQQSLIDLDEEWNRTQKEWDIQDQINMLNELKERALADIDLSIQAIRATIEAAEQAKQAAIDGIEAEIAGIEEAITATEQKAEEEIALIDEQFKMLSQTIAEAIKNGTADGVANTQAEIDKALVDGTNAMLSFIDSTNQTFTQTSQETANTVYGIYDTSFITPMYGEINNIAFHMQTAMTEGASSAAQAALTQFRNSFITPLKNEMASILSQSEKAKQTIATTTPQVTTKITGTSGKFVKPEGYVLKSTEQLANWNKTGPNIYITNHNLTPQSAARRTQTEIVQSILNFH